MFDVALDFETHYAKDYSLKVMPPVLYVRDERFKVFGVGIAIGNQPARWFTGNQIESAIDTIDWSDAQLVGHNLLFDALILNEHYGKRPARYLDTLYMASMVLPVGVKRDLDSVGEHLGIGGKQGKESLDTLKGVRDPTPGNLAHLGEYCKTDVEITREIKNRLLPAIPETELQVFHLITRMGVEPTIVLDEPLLVQELEDVKAKRAKKIDASGKDISVLSSNDQFLALLSTLVPTDHIPYKENPKGETIPAFAKNDAAWIKFKTNHPELADLCEARENAKSTIHVTRTQRFLGIARTEQGTLPMPMKGWGAHTGRPSGAGGLNVMNLPALYRSNLRRALRAPEDHVIAVCDSAQIELRTQLWLSGQMDKHDLLAGGQDLYRHNAAAIYGIPVSRVTDMQRKIGKAASLGLQYRMGATRYRGYMAGGPLGMDPVFFTQDEAQDVVNAFRADNPYTVAMWSNLDLMLAMMYQPDPGDDAFIGPAKVVHEGLVLPNGAIIDYTGLRATEEGGWAYGVNGTTKFLHGGIVLENCLAEGTLVLTDSGWKPIQSVTKNDLVHDGYGWTTHGGSLLRSPNSACITLDGVDLTPDHEVLTDEGWKPAQANPRPYRPALRDVDRATLHAHPQRGPAVHAALPVVTRPVYDILNAGPRQRFVVLGTEGPFIVHNCTQALANVIVMEQLVRIDRELPARVVGTTYDEVIAICHKSVADEVVAGMIEIMSVTPSWAPGLVLSAEGDFAENYTC